MGAGFIKDMINSTRSNRGLLKGNDAAAYNSFDTSAYKVSAKRRLSPKFKEASPELLLELRARIKADNLRVATIKRRIIYLSLIAATACLAIIFLVKF